MEVMDKVESIYRYICNNYHVMQMKIKGMYSIDSNVLIKEIYEMISNMEMTYKLASYDIPKLIFFNTSERKSKYIITEEGHYIVLDIRQIVECAFGSEVAIAIDGDMLFTVSGVNRDDNGTNILMSSFLYSSDKNLLKARICNCYNLADLCFSRGYVDAAVKNLCSIKMIKEDVSTSNLYDLFFSQQISNESKYIGGFIYLHELTHYYIRYNKKNSSKMNEYKDLLNLIRIRYESGVLGEIWKKYAREFSSDNYIENKNISDLFFYLRINDKYPELIDQLNENILSWKNMCFDLDNWDLYSEELICDIEALNMLIYNKTGNYYIISFIIRALLIQETFSLQNNLLMYITEKRKSLSSLNIKRVQLIFSALIVDYQEYSNNQESKSIIKFLDYNNDEFSDLIVDICNSVEVIHENFYLTAIQDFCKSLLSEDILHKHINCAYYSDDDLKNFIFTDNYNGEKHSGRYITNIDAVLLQNELTQEYDKFVDYIFK